MADQGDIRTCFLTARLPRWAGVRHDIIGSNISGLPVPSPETLTMTGQRTVTREQFTTLSEQTLQLTAALSAAVDRITQLENELQQLKTEMAIRHNEVV